MDVEAEAKNLRSSYHKASAKSQRLAYLLTVSFHSKEAAQWAPKGFELCWDQLEILDGSCR